MSRKSAICVAILIAPPAIWLGVALIGGGPAPAWVAFGAFVFFILLFAAGIFEWKDGRHRKQDER